MGIERDYIMRQLMMLFEMVSRIFRYRRKGEKRKAFDEISRFYNVLNIDADVRKLDIEDLVRLLVDNKKLTNEHIEMVAYVLKEQGELEENVDQKIDFFRKSYFLLDKVDRESVTFSMDRQMKIAELRQFINRRASTTTNN
ncbi:MAG: hypothetical protein CSA36_00300 [Draconibacterium sp.]|nr:MAG: hypothetical protein CSA36_00300 [Draconibacterium sp.]